MDFGPIRMVKEDLVLSPSLPRAAIQYSSDLIYLGDLQYIARDKYYVEDFIFLEPNTLDHVSRLLLLHFEGFLHNKEGVYEVPESETIRMDGEDYLYEINFINIQDQLATLPMSDLAHAADYIRQRAYTLAGDMTYQRFVHIFQPDRRNKFVIAFLEANDGPIVTAETLRHNPAVAQALKEAALKTFTIRH